MIAIPPIPKINVSQVERARRVLLDTASECVGKVPTAEVLARLATLWCRRLECEYLPVFESVKYLGAMQATDKVLTPELLFPVAWRLAGNIRRVRQGYAAHAWSGQHEPEWAPFSVRDVILSKHPRRPNEHVFLGTLQYLAGTPCGVQVTKPWTPNMCVMLARTAGFSKVSGVRPYASPFQLVGLRFLVLVVPERTYNGLPGFLQVHDRFATSWNNKIINIRTRRKPCPKGWNHPCHKCVVGYDKCEAATHPVTYEMRWCGVCGGEQFSDPRIVDCCVACDTKRRLAVPQENEETV